MPQEAEPFFTYHVEHIIARRHGGGGVRLRVRTNSGVKVLIGQKHWSVRSGRQLRRRETGWRAAGSERPVHKQDNDELDSA